MGRSLFALIKPAKMNAHMHALMAGQWLGNVVSSRMSLFVGITFLLSQCSPFTDTSPLMLFLALLTPSTFTNLFKSKYSLRCGHILMSAQSLFLTTVEFIT